MKAVPGAAPTGELLLPGDVVEVVGHQTVVAAVADSTNGAGFAFGLFRGRAQKLLQLADDRGWVHEHKLTQFKGTWNAECGWHWGGPVRWR